MDWPTPDSAYAVDLFVSRVRRDIKFRHDMIDIGRTAFGLLSHLYVKSGLSTPDLVGPAQNLTQGTIMKILQEVARTIQKEVILEDIERFRTALVSPRYHQTSSSHTTSDAELIGLICILRAQVQELEEIAHWVLDLMNRRHNEVRSLDMNVRSVLLTYYKLTANRESVKKALDDAYLLFGRDHLGVNHPGVNTLRRRVYEPRH